MSGSGWYQRPFLFLFLFVLISIPVGLWMALPKKEFDEFSRNAPVFIREELLAGYPEDLEIEINEGVVEINRELPYCLVLWKENREKIGIVFDKNPEVSELMQEKNVYSHLCKAMGLVGENYIVYPDEEVFKVQKLAKEVNLKIDRIMLDGLVDKYLPVFLTWIERLYIIGPFLLVPLVFLGFLMKNLWYGWVLKMVAKLFKFRKMSSGEAYKSSLLVYAGWSAFAWLGGLILKQTTGRTVSWVPFVFFNTILITTISLYSVKSGIIDFSENESGTQPTNPTQPRQPMNPVEPKQLVDPTEPTKPVKPIVPDSIKPLMSKPVKPERSKEKASGGVDEMVKK